MAANRNRNNRQWSHSNYGKTSNKSWVQLKSGQCGLFFTVKDGEENRATREAHQLIDHLLSISTKSVSEHPAYSADTSCAGGGEKDVSDALKNACKELSSSTCIDPNSGVQNKPVKWNHMQVADTKTKNTLFFVGPEVNEGNVYTLARSIVSECQDQPRTRFLARITPIEETISALPDNFPSAIKKFISDKLTSFLAAEPKKNPILRRRVLAQKQ